MDGWTKRCAVSWRIVTLALTALLSACAAAPQLADTCVQQAAIAHACIPVESLAEWESVDDSTVLLWAPGATRAFLLRLTRPIQYLTQLQEVEIADGDSDRMICACGRDGIVDALSGRSARFASIEYLSEQRTAELLGPASSIL
jgi:hypothetical protein